MCPAVLNALLRGSQNFFGIQPMLISSHHKLLEVTVHSPVTKSPATAFSLHLSTMIG